MTAMLVLVVLAALVFDFVNGWNDSANAIATVVSTRVLAPSTAVLMAAVLNVFGALLSTRVAKTIGGGLLEPKLVDDRIVLAAMIGAAGWVTFCTLRGLPISGSHSLIGGLVGAAVAALGPDVLNWNGLGKVAIALVASPLLGFAIAWSFVQLLYGLAAGWSATRARRVFGVLQIGSAGFMALTHGMNDAQKVMGVITLALYSAGLLGEITVPVWVILLCALVMGVGTAAGGWKVIRTLGSRLAHIRPVEGFAAETGGAVVLSLAAWLGLPVSTTHTITGSVLGVGTAYRVRAVRWGIGNKILYAWVLTIPAAGLVSAAVMLLLRSGG